MSSGSMRRLAAFGFALALGLCGGAVPAAGTSYPTKPVKVVVGFAPGGGSDFIARVIAPRLGEKLGQPVIVDNKPGAGGNLAADYVVKAAPDGYTLYLAAASYTVNPAVYKLTFDPIKDIAPVAQLAHGPFIIAVNPKLPVGTLKDLVEYAKKNPGKLSYASAGTGSIVHMATEYFLATAGIEALHVPYKGTSPALTDTIGGQTQLVFGTVASTIPFVKSGQLKGLAVTTATRLAALPDVPTVAESGYPQFVAENWHGIVAPKGTPPEIVARLNQVINESLKDPKMASQLAIDGLTAASGSPEDFAAVIRSETQRWQQVAKSRGIHLE